MLGDYNRVDLLDSIMDINQKVTTVTEWQIIGFFTKPFNKIRCTFPHSAKFTHNIFPERNIPIIVKFLFN